MYRAKRGRRGAARLLGFVDLMTTGNQFDLAIQGRGFFEILLPDGTQAYTRDGTFQINYGTSVNNLPTARSA